MYSKFSLYFILFGAGLLFGGIRKYVSISGVVIMCIGLAIDAIASNYVDEDASQNIVKLPKENKNV